MVATIITAFRLKGSLLTLTVMQLCSDDIAAVSSQLSETVRESPTLFKNMPLVIDLQAVANKTLDFTELCNVLRQYNLLPVAISNPGPTQLEAANAAGLGVLKINRDKPKPAEKPAPEPTAEAKPEPDAAKAAETEPSAAQPAIAQPTTKPMIVSQPVRSGQRIYAKGTDLIVLASVSNGSEVIADGNIHVYGILRGRALAGASGDQQARIFAQTLMPELISVAGIYQLSDKIRLPGGVGPYSVRLDEEQLLIEIV